MEGIERILRSFLLVILGFGCLYFAGPLDEWLIGLGVLLVLAGAWLGLFHGPVCRILRKWWSRLDNNWVDRE